MYIRVQKDPQQNWLDMPYIAIDDAINKVIECCPIDWHSPSDLSTGTRKGAGSSTKKKKEEAVKYAVQKLVVQWRKEVEEKAQLEQEHAGK